MKAFILIVFVAAAIAFAACDLRSDTAKREMEKFSGTPTPQISPTPTEAPIDPSDIIQADTSQQGSSIAVNGSDEKKAITCSKLDRITINAIGSTVTIKGACREIVVNGDNNQINSDAAMEIAANGSGNTVRYSKYVNGKRPIVTNKGTGNTIEKAAVAQITK